MTVSELIERLQKHPADKEVKVSDINGEFQIPIHSTLTCGNCILILPGYAEENSTS